MAGFVGCGREDRVVNVDAADRVGNFLGVAWSDRFDLFSDDCCSLVHSAGHDEGENGALHPSGDDQSMCLVWFAHDGRRRCLSVEQ